MPTADKIKYRPTIGIECHVQLKTKTKLFAAVGNDASEAPPNSLISHICLGLPGALPVLNEEALELSALAAFALNSQPQAFSKFERKHYFYPDLPKGYQITQYEDPIIVDGHIVIDNGDGQQEIGIERANLEEDAGKNIHPAGADYSLVDLNRAGTPLLEIVSRPDIHSAAEAKAFVRELYLLMKYSDVSDCDLYRGHMRFDINVSVSADPDKLGTRSEVKNLNSFRSVEAAAAYEIARQTDVLKSGGKVVQETRGWDEVNQKTLPQRAKEEAQDYRYMPDPDIPPVELSSEMITEFKRRLPLLPAEIRLKLAKTGLEKQLIEDVLDEPDICSKVLKAIEIGGSPEAIKRIAHDSLKNPQSLQVDTAVHLKIASAFESGQLSSTGATKVLEAIVGDSTQDVEMLIERNAQVSDTGVIEKIVKKVIEDNPKVVADIRAGQQKAVGFLVGQVMAESKGQANPGLAQEIIKQLLSKQ